MAIIKCKECGKELSSYAKACPHCGCPQGKQLEKILNQQNKVSIWIPNIYVCGYYDWEDGRYHLSDRGGYEDCYVSIYDANQCRYIFSHQSAVGRRFEFIPSNNKIEIKIEVLMPHTYSIRDYIISFVEKGKTYTLIWEKNYRCLKED